MQGRQPTLDEGWATISYLFTAYTSLGGNGEIRALYNIAEEYKATK